jgi:hypothetical protein
VAGAAGGKAARRVALGTSRARPRRSAGDSAAARARIGQVEAGEVGGDLAQVGVVERRQQIRHQRIGAPAVAEVQQLVEQVARGLAGDARVVAVGRGPALGAVAAGAGEQALRHGVRERPGEGRRRDEEQQERGEARRPRAARPQVTSAFPASRTACAIAAASLRASGQAGGDAFAVGARTVLAHLPFADQRVSTISTPTIAFSIVST